MSRRVYAVIDTNVLVASLITRYSDSATVQILDYIIAKQITPVYNEDILREYHEVLSRPKFKFAPGKIKTIIDAIAYNGISVDPTHYPFTLPDPTDRVFYEVSLTADSFLVTGNTKHFPVTPKVVTPAELIAIINSFAE